MEKRKVLYVTIGSVFGISIIIFVSKIFQFLIDWFTTFNGTGDGWLGFWGGCIGSIIGVAGAYVILQRQLRKERETYEEVRTDNTFFNLLNMFIDQQNYLVSEKENKKDIFEIMLENIRKESYFAYREVAIELFYSKKPELLSIMNKAIEASEDYVEEKKIHFTEEEKRIIERINNKGRSISKPSDISTKDLNDAYYEIQRKAYMNEFKRMIENKRFVEVYPTINSDFGLYQINEHINYTVDSDADKLMDEDVKAYLTNLVKDLEEYLKDRPDVELSLENKKRVVEVAQEPHRKQVGSYFRIFHRIIKYLNENVNDIEIKKNYIGFLRANMNENQMAMIFYNINYTHRGSGAIEELKGTGFFGEKTELIDLENAHFFSPETLIWGNYDLKKMQEFC